MASLYAHCGNNARNKLEVGTMPYSYRLMTLKILCSTVNTKLLNMLEQCIYTATNTDIRPSREANPVLLNSEPQRYPVSHRDRPVPSVFLSVIDLLHVNVLCALYATLISDVFYVFLCFCHTYVLAST